MKIEKLTAEQEKLIPVIRDEYIKFALGGDTSIDEKKLKKGIEWLYSLAKLEKPKFILIITSPIGCQIAANILPKYLEALKQKPLNGAQVGDQVRAQVGAQVGDQVWDQVRDQVRAQVRDQVRAQVRDQKAEYFPPSYVGIGGWSGFSAWAKFFQNIKLKLDSKLENWFSFYESGAWDIIMLKDVCYVSRRPLSVLKDKNNRLHCENGSAVTWLDGAKNYFWHGTSVNEKIILHPEQLTKEEILSEKNSEVSRAIAEKLGWDEYLKRVDTVLIDKWFDCGTKNHYELYDFKIRKGSMMPRLLKMESPELNDGTRPYYIEPVDPGIKTAQAARKWQIPKPDGSWPTVKECNESPELIFEWEA